MDKFDSIFFGGTGWNLLWSFGASKKLHELGFNKKIKRVGGLSCGALSALAFIDSASYEVGIVQSEQLFKERFLFSRSFIKKFKYYADNFLNKSVIEDIKKSNVEFNIAYANLKLTSLKLKIISDFSSRQDLIDKCVAGCNIPLILGVHNTIFPKISNGDYVLDAGFLGDSYHRWDEKTLVVAPTEKSNENTIGGNYTISSALGLRNNKMSDKSLFLSGYLDASKWYADHYLYNNAWQNESNWHEKTETFDEFLKRGDL